MLDPYKTRALLPERLAHRAGRFCFGRAPCARQHSGVERFAILLGVRVMTGQVRSLGKITVCFALAFGAMALALPVVSQNRPPWATPKSASSQNPPAVTPATAAPGYQPMPATPALGLNIVVLDPAHGGTDLGARGTEGIRESEVVLLFTTEVKRALEAQGFQVITTRTGNENPSFDDRSARANAQRGAVFITLHIASTGLAGTARVYVMPDIPPAGDASGLIPWDRAQGPFQELSRKLGDAVQIELSKRFKGSPNTVQVAPVRQLRTTAAPAIAVEISSVSVAEREALDRMIPGVAESIARGVVAFKPTYVIPSFPVPAGAARP